MITIQKLPSLEPEMRGALRNHIMRKRQRLKQELEQDAIEKRMKKEREQKRIQDAMTLDQIKEQLSTLEKRLETLRNEKHNLFVQLKQVLNEGSSKRKQASETNTVNSESSQSGEQSKRPKIEEAGQQAKSSTSDQPTSVAAVSTTTTTTTTSAPPATTSSANTTAISTAPSTTSSTRLSVTTTIGNPIETVSSKPTQMTFESRISELSPVHKPISHLRQKSQPSQHASPLLLPNHRPQPPQTSSYDPSSTLNNSLQNQHSTELRLGLPSVPQSHAHSFINHQSQHPDMVNFSRHDPIPPSSSHSMSSQQLAALQAHFRSPFAGSGLPGQIPPELLMAGRLDPNLQRFGSPLGLHGRLPLTSMPPDVSMSLAQSTQQNADSNKMLNSFGNAPKSSFPGSLDMNGGRWDERLLSLKKGPSGSSGLPFHPSQLLVDGSLPPSLAHLNFLNQAALSGNIDPSTSIGQSMLSLGPNNMQSPMNLNPRKMLSGQNTPRSGVDFLMGQIKPGSMLIPNLGPIYTSQPSGTPHTPPTSIFGPGGQIDLEHLNSLYHPSLSQHMAGSMAHFNNSMAKQQQQHQLQQQHNLDQQHLQSLHHQQEQASRFLSMHNSANYNRKPTPKNPYR